MAWVVTTDGLAVDYFERSVGCLGSEQRADHEPGDVGA